MRLALAQIHNSTIAKNQVDRRPTKGDHLTAPIPVNDRRHSIFVTGRPITCCRTETKTAATAELFPLVGEAGNRPFSGRVTDRRMDRRDGWAQETSPQQQSIQHRMSMVRKQHLDETRSWSAYSSCSRSIAVVLQYSAAAGSSMPDSRPNSIRSAIPYAVLESPYTLNCPRVQA